MPRCARDATYKFAVRNVSQSDTRPLSSPRLNQRTRCSADPWVNESGTTRPVDCRAIIESGMTLALATDICPGAWLPSMQFVINLACRLYKLSPAEAIRAATLGAAAAIDRTDTIGSLEPGKLADVLILDVERHEDLAYRLGRNAVQTVIKRGRVVSERLGH